MTRVSYVRLSVCDTRTCTPHEDEKTTLLPNFFFCFFSATKVVLEANLATEAGLIVLDLLNTFTSIFKVRLV